MDRTGLPPWVEGDGERWDKPPHVCASFTTADEHERPQDWRRSLSRASRPPLLACRLFRARDSLGEPAPLLMALRDPEKVKVREFLITNLGLARLIPLVDSTHRVKIVPGAGEG